jgi:hypothetical protein
MVQKVQILTQLLVQKAQILTLRALAVRSSSGVSICTFVPVKQVN